MTLDAVWDVWTELMKNKYIKIEITDSEKEEKEAEIEQNLKKKLEMKREAEIIEINEKLDKMINSPLLIPKKNIEIIGIINNNTVDNNLQSKVENNLGIKNGDVNKSGSIYDINQKNKINNSYENMNVSTGSVSEIGTDGSVSTVSTVFRTPISPSSNVHSISSSSSTPNSTPTSTTTIEDKNNDKDNDKNNDKNTNDKNNDKNTNNSDHKKNKNDNDDDNNNHNNNNNNNNNSDDDNKNSKNKIKYNELNENKNNLIELKNMLKHSDGANLYTLPCSLSLPSSSHLEIPQTLPHSLHHSLPSSTFSSQSSTPSLYPLSNVSTDPVLSPPLSTVSTDIGGWGDVHQENVLLDEDEMPVFTNNPMISKEKETKKETKNEMKNEKNEIKISFSKEMEYLDEDEKPFFMENPLRSLAVISNLKKKGLRGSFMDKVEGMESGNEGEGEGEEKKEAEGE